MPPAKATVLEVLDRLPDDCTLEDVLYRLYVVQKVSRGLADVDAGRTVPHETAMRELRAKWVAGRDR